MPHRSREQSVISAITESYEPVLNALKDEYPERYPRVCGPASIVLPRSNRVQATGVPLQLGGPGERFELDISIYNNGLNTPDEHTYVRYFTGTGHVFYIDYIYPLLWEHPNNKVPGPIIEKYHEDEIDQALADQWYLFPYSDTLSRQLGINLWGSGDMPRDPMQDYRDIRTAMHDDRAFADTLTTSSSEIRPIHKAWGQRTARVVRAVGGVALR